MTALSPKRQRFVEEYLVDLNATQAATRAGYGPRTARQQGQRLLTKADIQEAIEEAQARRSERVQETQDDVLRELRRLQRAAERAGRYAAAIRAAELRGKHLGMFQGDAERDDNRLRGAIVYLPTPLPPPESNGVPKALPRGEKRRGQRGPGRAPSGHRYRGRGRPDAEVGDRPLRHRRG